MIQAAEKLSMGIRIPTVSYTDTSRRDREAFSRWAPFLKDLFPMVHRELEQIEVGELAILFRWQGRNRELPAAALLAHFDVVPPGDESRWRYPPFSGEIADGYVWGRGAIDDKLSDIAILEAVELLLAEGFVPERTVYLCFGGDEEIGGKEGASSIVNYFANHQERLAWVLDEGGAIVDGVIDGLAGPAAMVGVAEKGHINLRLRSSGSGGHASAPPRETAVTRLAEAIRRLQKNPFPRRMTPTVHAFLTALGRELGGFQELIFRLRPVTNPLILRNLAGNPRTESMVRTTQAVTMVRAGTAENVLPDAAEAVVNIRLLHGDSVEGAVERIRRVVGDPGIEVELYGSWGNIPAIEASRADHPWLTRLEEVLARQMPGTPVLPYLMTGSTDSAAYAPVSEAIFRFVPMVMSSGELGRVHNIDERISVENIERALHCYTDLIRTTCGAEDMV